jgi:hypothetical protein
MYATTLKICPYFAIFTESGIKPALYICMYALTLKTGPYFVILTESARAAGRALIISGICDAVQPEHKSFLSVTNHTGKEK